MQTNPAVEQLSRIKTIYGQEHPWSQSSRWREGLWWKDLPKCQVLTLSSMIPMVKKQSKKPKKNSWNG